MNFFRYYFWIILTMIVFWSGPRMLSAASTPSPRDVGPTKVPQNRSASVFSWSWALGAVAHCRSSVWGSVHRFLLLREVFSYLLCCKTCVYSGIMQSLQCTECSNFSLPCPPSFCLTVFSYESPTSGPSFHNSSFKNVFIMWWSVCCCCRS
jgi:hypothetical protein